ncbi:MAG: DsbE family thiol:disulfide interchange protein [Rhodospirillaceae bacterium]|jgi:cytochrome c biogenesis protein CcmG, thiol:disulfide interchange protein DsbE|nr:DsbE family thiol:disulfide interchange protein [Rhodospirillaceae bacterium]MBT5375007.1 DsbE family thiol:disulfide interchange protein [Rhodospirillaceae bacterium]MBT5751243.1 DsbE family thiol:disulfide interchange protein [Rhodospirillaceae bacterium]
MRWTHTLPVIIFALLAIAFAIGLTRNPERLPSALIDKPAPQFDLGPIAASVAGEEPLGGGLTTSDLDTSNGVVLVNIFASWCVPCLAEHPQLMALAQSGIAPVYGINKKDTATNARNWLAENGNPYARIGADIDGRASIEWGVYGVPETFILDQSGRIRYRHVGPIMPRDMEKTILPLIEEIGKK